MTYLMEARRYEKLAKEAKEELNQDSNQSLGSEKLTYSLGEIPIVPFG
jgi:hypothetical protein